MIRTGFGFDVHPFKTGRKFVLGGVNIPFDKGLDGHSDADVLVHAVIDALLGAAALGDIGTLFPDNDKRFENADSLLLLKEVFKKIKNQGYRIANLDSTLVLQKPQIASYLAGMRNNMALILDAEPGAVSVKATTTEYLGFTGRGEGVAAFATVLLVRE